MKNAFIIAYTDIIVSDSKAKTITSGSLTYYLVSEISLNNGTGGAPIYLYFTKDTKAGGGISSLDTVSGFSDKDEIIPILNDGSSPVRTQNGKLANFDKGIENCELYLIKNSEESVRPYISDIRIVSGKSKSEAVIAAADSGCDFYLAYNLNKSDGFTLVAYQRTSDKADAVTDFRLNGSELSIEKNKDSAKFLLDISDSLIFENKFTLSDWAELFISTSKSVSDDAAAYKPLSESKDECSCVSVGTSFPLFAVYLGKTENQEQAVKTEEPTEVQSKASDATDDLLDIDKEEETSEVDVSESSEMTISSVLGNGNIRNIAIFSIVIIAVLICVRLIMKGKKHNEKDN